MHKVGSCWDKSYRKWIKQNQKDFVNRWHKSMLCHVNVNSQKESITFKYFSVPVGNIHFLILIFYNFSDFLPGLKKAGWSIIACH